MSTDSATLLPTATPDCTGSAEADRPALKILLISSEFPPETGFGGIGTYVSHLAPALAARGHRVTVLSRSVSGADSEAMINGVRVVRLVNRPAPAELWNEPFNRRFATMAKDHYDRAYTVALALEGDPTLGDADIIEAPDWAGEAALVRLVRPDTPYVVKFHTPAKLVFGWNGDGVSANFVESLHALERIAVINAMGFTSPSRWLVPQVEKTFGLPPGRVVALPNPFTASTPLDRSPERTVLYVGRLEARKGILEAVEPVVRLLRCMPDLRWRLAGADTLSGPGGGSMKAALEARIPMDLRPRVEFLGSLGRERLAEEFARAGVVLLPSRQENFPYACLEAMAAGAPVVGSKRGGMTEMIADGHNGLLVDPAAPGEIFDALLRILEQPFFADGIGRAARKSVAAHFHPEVIAPLVETHYRHVIAYAQTP